MNIKKIWSGIREIVNIRNNISPTITQIMHNRLYHFLEVNNILYSKQFGSRKNNSTMNALINITEKIKESIDKGKYTVLCKVSRLLA